MIEITGWEYLLDPSIVEATTAGLGFAAGLATAPATKVAIATYRAISRWRKHRRDTRAAARLSALAADLATLQRPTAVHTSSIWAATARRVAVEKGYEGLPCDECGQLTVIRQGMGYRCDTCAAKWNK